MNKIKLTIASLSLVVLPVIALAQLPTSWNDAPEGIISDPFELAARIAGLMWLVFGVIALICFVLAGVLFLTAQGDPEKIATARGAFIWGVVGVVVGIIAWSIITVVTTTFK